MSREHPELPTPAEMAIKDAVHEVEKLPRSPLLMKAIVRLNEAYTFVSRHIEKATT